MEDDEYGFFPPWVLVWCNDDKKKLSPGQQQQHLRQLLSSDHQTAAM